MNRLASCFVALVAVTAVFLTANLAWSEFLSLSIRDLLGLSSFAVLAILSEVLAITFQVGSEKRPVRSSIAFLPLLACVVVFPPAAAVAAVTVVVLFETTSAKIRPAWKAVFNVSQGIVSVGFAAVVYEWLGAELNIPLLSFTGLVLTFFITNILAISLVLALQGRQNIQNVIRYIISAGGNTLLGLLASPIAVFAAILYEEFYIGGLLLITLPLLLVRYSYLSKVQLEQANRDLLTVLVKAIETRDPYTSGHSVRVSKLAREIASDLDLSRRKVTDVETAGLLHDIGKIDASYAPLINKTEALSDDERTRIRTHATKGADLLGSLPSVGDEVVNGVRHHHERFNGTGYPDGLTGKAIPIAARIIAVCDAIDAMLSDRPYRPALTINEVGDELRRCAGSQFDPEIVDAILSRDTLERAASLIDAIGRGGTDRPVRARATR